MLSNDDTRRLIHGCVFMLLSAEEKLDEATALAERVGLEDMLWAVTTIGLTAIADVTETDDDPEPILAYLRFSLLALAHNTLHSNN